MHLIMGYEKIGDKLLEEIALPLDTDIVVLRKLFGLRNDDPMVECYPIDAPKAEAFAKIFSIQLAINNFDYFLEFDACASAQ